MTEDEFRNGGVSKSEEKIDIPSREAAKKQSLDIKATLDERGSRYGEFYEHARITQNIKKAMIDSPNWDRLTPAMKECLEMVAHKVGRILNGDPNYHDSWHDIEGYVRLVSETLEIPPKTA